MHGFEVQKEVTAPQPTEHEIVGPFTCTGGRWRWRGERARACVLLLLLQLGQTKNSNRTTGLDDAVRLFEQSPRRDAVSWNIIISEYSSEGNVSEVVYMYEKMRREEVCPSCQTLTAVVAAFAKRRCLQQGKKLHSFAVRIGLSDAILVASFVDFYARSGELASSVRLFDEFKRTSSCIWSAMIWGFIHHGQFLHVIHLFRRMPNSPLVPSADVLQGLVISYTKLGALRLGKATHGYIIRNNHAVQSENSAWETSIVKLYASCGSIHLAQRCFNSIHQKDIVAWSSMFEVYATHGYGREALALFHQMLSKAKWSDLPELSVSM